MILNFIYLITAIHNTKSIEFQGEIDKHVIIDIFILLSVIDRTSKQKISEDTDDLKNIPTI